MIQVAGRLHVEVMRVTGTVPERVSEDDSSENSSESGSLEVVDSSGEVIHRVKKLTCRVRGQHWASRRPWQCQTAHKVLRVFHPAQQTLNCLTKDAAVGITSRIIL